MEHESVEDKFLEKIILFLVVIVGAILLFNQFQLVKFSSNVFFSSVAFLLILALIALVIWLFLDKFNRNRQLKHHHVGHETEKTSFTFTEKLSYGFVGLVAVLIIFNQLQISQVNALISGTSSTLSSFTRSISSTPLKLIGSGKGSVIIGPQLNTDGRTTKLVEWPTISGAPAPKNTGNPTQDAISVVVPTGTPFYVLQGEGADKIKGVTFDDPITSQKVWASLLGSKRFGTANALQLAPDEEKRWQKLTSVFTCDFCCGGPSSVTTINRCGCAHSYAWQGMAKFFIKYYPQYTDEQILGEMTKWKGLWYPKGMIQDYLVYTGQQDANSLTHGGSVGIKQQFLQQAPNNQQQTKASVTPLEDLPSMVGGC